MANAKFVVYKNKGGEYTWHLKSSNGQTTATAGEAFSSKESAKRAAEAVKEHAATAEVVVED